MTWQDVRDRVVRASGKGEAWQSNKKHLLEIIEYCSEQGLPSSDAEVATISNLRAVVPMVRRATRWDDLKQVMELFSWAANDTYKDLRAKIRPTKRKRIVATKIVGDGEALTYELQLDPEDFERFRRSFRDAYSFETRGGAAQE